MRRATIILGLLAAGPTATLLGLAAYQWTKGHRWAAAAYVATIPALYAALFLISAWSVSARA